MQQQLTAQDICKLIEVLVDTSNAIGRILHFNGIGRKNISEYKVNKLEIQELYFVEEPHIQAVSISYDSIDEIFVDTEEDKSASTILQLLENLYQKQEDIRQNKSIEEILNIIRNETTNGN